MAKDGDAGAERPAVRRREALVRFDDADAPAVLPERLEPDRTRDRGKERVVLSAAHVSAGMDMAAALAHDNRPGGNKLAGKSLHAEALSVTVAPILGTAYTFFVCHAAYP